MFGLSSLLHAENGGVHVVVSEWMHVGQAGQGLPLGIYVYGRTGKGARVGPGNMCAFVRHHGDLYCLVTAVSQSILYPLFLPYDTDGLCQTGEKPQSGVVFLAVFVLRV